MDHRCWIAAAILLAGTAGARAAADLEEIVVSATRTAEPSLDLPMSVDSVSGDALHRGQLQVNLSESLGVVPGLLVRNRENYAQDLQISSRGFGAHTTFGVTGLRIYIDGIPASQPDGQGQVSNVDLASAARVEVLRGPFSALYGNSAGGVIAVFTEDGRPGTAVEADALTGADGQRRFGVKLSGDQGGFNYVADAADFMTDGLRPHSSANRGNVNAKLRYTFADGSQLTVLANAVNIEADDPLGLTRSQFDTNPDQAGTGAIAFDTRKTVDQEQFGLRYVRAIGDSDRVEALAYGGNRAVTQFQAIPLATQAAPASPGGVIDLAIGYGGGDLHWIDRRTVLGMPVQVTAGVSTDLLDETRRGFQNFIGTVLGVAGALRRDESDQVYDIDEYVQAQLEPDPHWLVEAGMRNNLVPVSSHDRYIVRGNGDDSGSVTYGAATPVGGVTWRAGPEFNLHAAYGEGFQTPTLDQLAYRSTNGSLPGLNLGLHASHSRNTEIGVKSLLGEDTRLDLAVFHIATTDELAVVANSAGRAVYQNVGSTDRDGVELGLDRDWGHGLASRLAYTYLRAVYGDQFRTCPTLPCKPVLIPAGNRLPGIPLHTVYGTLSWSDPGTGFSAGLEEQVETRVFVNDPNSDAAPFYATSNLRLGLEHGWGGSVIEEFIRLDNLTDRRYAGSVIVNETSGRYFEPGPGRSAYVGASVRF